MHQNDTGTKNDEIFTTFQINTLLQRNKLHFLMAVYHGQRLRALTPEQR
jgi:hypothetical protein